MRITQQQAAQQQAAQQLDGEKDNNMCDEMSFSAKQLNFLKGKFASDKMQKEDIEYLFDYIDHLEECLDESDDDDCLSTEGWRHYMGVE